MAKKIEDFERLSSKAQADKSKLQNEIDELIRREAELADAASAAAERGDVETYMAKTAEKERTTATIFVRRTQLDRMKPFTDAEVLESWKDYAVGYNKEFIRKSGEYERAADVLRKMFVGLCELQNSALTMRARFGAFVEDASALNRVKLETVSNDTGGIRGETIRGRARFSETVAMEFVRTGAKTPEEDDDLLQLFNTVVVQHKPLIK